MVLNRFTTIEKMLEILQTETIPMSDPNYWEDKNDSFILNIYKSKKKLKSLYALCFTIGSETIYHWGAFSSKNEACCIEIDSNSFNGICNKSGFRMKEVSYVSLKDLQSKVTDISQIPFLKRFPYWNEKEYRIIFESKKKTLRPSLALKRCNIKRITINQYLPKQLFDLINEKIESVWKVTVTRSTIIKNDRWVSYMEKLEI